MKHEHSWMPHKGPVLMKLQPGHVLLECTRPGCFAWRTVPRNQVPPWHDDRIRWVIGKEETTTAG